jgi:ABC-type branched-subunit amino acid transport system substrate-binding protein
VALMRLAAGEPLSSVGPNVLSLCDAQLQALIVALDAVRAAEALRVSQARRCAAQHLVFSETGALLAARAAKDGSAPHPFAGLLVTQVVPHPQQRLHPLVDEFQRERALHGSSASNTHGSLEGYLALRVVIEALGACAREPDRKCLLHVLGSRSFDLPGVKVQFGRAQRQQRPFVEINLIDAQGRLRR